MVILKTERALRVCFHLNFAHNKILYVPVIMELYDLNPC